MTNHNKLDPIHSDLGRETRAATKKDASALRITRAATKAAKCI